jgi:hypothetical protein
MRCEDVVELLSDRQDDDTLPVRTAREHAAACADCTAALVAHRALRAERHAPVPALPARSFAHALERATQPSVAPRRRSGFWLGTAFGGAVAAALAVGIAVLSRQPAVESLGNPRVEIALDQVSNVSLSVDSPEALMGAEIRVVLTGAVGLQGYDAQRELRWVTDLDRGVNELTLPVVALDAAGGQITVEVEHGAKRRTFVVDVRTPAAGSASRNDAV